MGRNIGPNSNIRTYKISNRSCARGRRRSVSAKEKPYLSMASTFVSLPKPFFAFPVKTVTSPVANHKLLLGTYKSETCYVLNLLGTYTFSLVSVGSRRGCLRIKAISTKWEPTKVLPFPFNFIQKCYLFHLFESEIVDMVIAGCSSSRQGSCSS